MVRHRISILDCTRSCPCCTCCINGIWNTVRFLVSRQTTEAETSVGTMKEQKSRNANDVLYPLFVHLPPSQAIATWCLVNYEAAYVEYRSSPGHCRPLQGNQSSRVSIVPRSIPQVVYLTSSSKTAVHRSVKTTAIWSTVRSDSSASPRRSGVDTWLPGLGIP
jgi:hypothetical protein